MGAKFIVIEGLDGSGNPAPGTGPAPAGSVSGCLHMESLSPSSFKKIDGAALWIGLRTSKEIIKIPI